MGVVMKPAVDAMTVTAVKGGTPLLPEKDRRSLGPHEFGGPYESRNLGDLFGLTQYGVMMETLPPGSRSSIRHWHTKSDEFVMVLEGELTLVTNEGETVMRSGMVVGFPAGKAMPIISSINQMLMPVFWWSAHECRETKCITHMMTSSGL